MGVVYDKARNKYRASYTLHGERHEVGRFDTELKAKRALNKHRKAEQEKYDFLKPQGTGLDDFKLDFENVKYNPKRKVTVLKPTIITRIRTLVGNGKIWLKEQLDR